MVTREQAKKSYNALKKHYRFCCVKLTLQATPKSRARAGVAAIAALVDTTGLYRIELTTSPCISRGMPTSAIACSAACT
eukprot:4474-Heterococcus_DN1.PRE.4